MFLEVLLRVPGQGVPLMFHRELSRACLTSQIRECPNVFRHNRDSTSFPHSSLLWILPVLIPGPATTVPKSRPGRPPPQPRQAPGRMGLPFHRVTRTALAVAVRNAWSESRRIAAPSCSTTRQSLPTSLATNAPSLMASTIRWHQNFSISGGMWYQTSVSPDEFTSPA
jgi:hypothetical protein